MLKDKIKLIVEEYQEVFKEEYTIFCNAMIDKKDLQVTEFASGVADGQFAYEIPETLHNMLQDMLTESEKQELKSKEMAQWFGRTFNQFSPAKKI